MAHVATTHDTRGFALGAPFRAIGAWLVRLAETNRLVQEADALHAMSDADLAAKGLRREDIPRYVFRDLLHL